MNNPNFPPQPEREANSDPFSPLDVDNLEQLRIAQKEILSKEEQLEKMQLGRTLLLSEDREKARARAEERWDDLITDYVHSFDDVEDPEKMKDEVVNFTFGNMDDVLWYQGERDEDGNFKPSGRESAHQMHEDLLGSYKASNERDEEEERRKAEEEAERERQERETNEEKERQLTDNLNKLRQQLAEASVKRQKSLKSAFTEKSTEEFDKIQSEYDKALIELGKFEEEKLDRESDEERDTFEKNAQVLSFLLNQAKLLREANNEEWKSTAIGKTAEFFSRGSLPVRIGKTALAGFVVTGVLAGATSVAIGTGGMVGAAIGAAAPPVLMATRLFRGYAAARGRKEGMATEFSDERKNDLGNAMGTEMDKAHELGAAHLRELFEEDIRGEHLKDRKSMKIALATAALGSGGVFLAEAAAGFFDFHPFEALHDKLAGLFDKKTGINTPGSHPTQTSSPDVNAHTPDHTGGTHPGGGKHVGGGGVHFSGHDLEAFDIAPGEGGFQLMHDLGHGLNNHDWLKMQDRLLDKHPHDFYRMPDGNVGLAHPGNLSRGAMKTIANYWREKHGLAA